MKIKLTVMVTRPEHQAKMLCEQIQAMGLDCFLFPTIQITQLENAEIESAIKNLNHADIVIFISPNAVQSALPKVQKIWPQWPSHLKIAAIGEATQRTLNEHQLHANFCPTEVFNSEALLKLPVMQALQSKKIIIFKGEGGREVLTETLQERGAKVQEINVYRRDLPKYDQTTVLPLKNIDLIVSTSNTGLQNLVTLMGPTHRFWLLNMSLLVVSERMANYAQNLGFVKMPFVANNASDAAIVAALKNWLETFNGKSGS